MGRGTKKNTSLSNDNKNGVGEVLVRVQSRQSNGRVQSFLRAHGAIIEERYSEGFVLIDAKLGTNQLPDLKRLKPEKLEIVKS